MLKPPFKLAMPRTDSTDQGEGARPPEVALSCCESVANQGTTSARAKLAELDQHLHCSVIGTCMGTAALRKLMARFLFVRDCSDLEVHHEAVRLSARSGPVAKALHKALDQQHESTVQRFSGVQDERALERLWEQALKHGEVASAYWAVLTHRSVTPELRQRAFGDVHMLSHLVGASNRADIRRLVALEAESEELRERIEKQQLRSKETLEERERTIHRLRGELMDSQGQGQASPAARAVPPESERGHPAVTPSLVALQTERRERAEQAAAVATDEASRLRAELEHLGRHVQALNRELAAAETQLREVAQGPGAAARCLDQWLKGRRVLYVGGRPSSTPAIRDLVLRHGGEFQHHDGGLEDRKGLLASGVAWAQLVAFPVDCIDHDSAGNLKRMCMRQSVAYLPLRGASVAGFAAALSALTGSGIGSHPDRSGPPGCLNRA